MKPGLNNPLPGQPLNSRQQMLDKVEEQMIIKSSAASNHELIKKIE